MKVLLIFLMERVVMKRVILTVMIIMKRITMELMRGKVYLMMEMRS